MKKSWILLPFCVLLIVMVFAGFYYSLYNSHNVVADPATGIELPRIYITGNVVEISDESTYLKFSYQSQDESFECYTEVQLQGATSRYYSKKNYKIELYEDATCQKDYSVKFKDWGEGNTFYLKGNFNDESQARNIVAGRLWGEVESTNRDRNEKMDALVNAGATDGFPVLVYLNDQCLGLYTLNIPKEEWAFQMSEKAEEKNAIVFAYGLQYANDEEGINGAEGLPAGVKIKYCSTQDTKWVEESFCDLWQFIYETDGEVFTERVHEFLDVDATIDYLIYISFIYGTDNSAKNMLWVTYDGQKWTPVPYDLDGTFGVYWSGNCMRNPRECLPTISEDGRVLPNYDNVLWDRLWNNYPDKMIDRYWELRKEVLNAEHISKLFEEFVSVIPDAAYQLNREMYPDMPGIGVGTIEQINEFIGQRSIYYDEFVEKLSEGLAPEKYYSIHANLRAGGGNVFLSVPKGTTYEGILDYLDMDTTSFLGWAEEEDCYQVVDMKAQLSSDQELYAVWESDLVQEIVSEEVLEEPERIPMELLIEMAAFGVMIFIGGIMIWKDIRTGNGG